MDGTFARLECLASGLRDRTGLLLTDDKGLLRSCYCNTRLTLSLTSSFPPKASSRSTRSSTISDNRKYCAPLVSPALHSLSAMTSPTTNTTAHIDPFSDPTGASGISSVHPSTNGAPHPPASLAILDPADADADVLIVDRNATLTLGTDALVVLDEGLRHQRKAATCCGLLPQLAKTTQAIPFYNVLWAELLDDWELVVRYAASTGKKSCAVRTITYGIMDKTVHTHAKRWVDRLLDRAYPPGAQRRKRIKVLINPFGGKGHATSLWTREVAPLFAAANCHVEAETTKYRAHAVEIAEHLDTNAWDVIACASGDGLPHEVWNGLARQPSPLKALRKIAVCQIPCGSGNALSLNFNGTESPSLAGLAIVKGVRGSFDLTAITQGEKTYYSFLSQAVGLIADCDLGTEALRWMGPFRFTWGALVRIATQKAYPADIAVVVREGSKDAVKSEYRRRVGEAEARQSNGNSPASLMDSSDHDEDAEGSMPPLRYGTIADPLPPAFVHESHPNLGNFFTGNMCHVSPDNAFFPTALPSDGALDMVAISALTKRTRSLAMLLSLADGGIIDFNEVSYRKVLAYRITPRIQRTGDERGLRKRVGRWLGGGARQRVGLIAVDGESVPFEPFQAEVLGGVATVLCKRPGMYEFDFARGRV